MLRAVLAALTLGTALVTPAAAGPPDDYPHLTGGCSFLSVETSPGQQSGEMDALAVAYSVWYEHNPVTIDYLTCDLAVYDENGINVVATVHADTAGPLAFAPPVPVSYAADPDDIVLLCESYRLVDAHGRTFTEDDRCWQTPDPTFPPRVVRDVVEYYGQGALDAVWAVVDPPLCALLVQARPHAVPGVLDIEADGDVYVAGGLVWDCPPYAT